MIVHESIAGRCLERLLAIYARLPIGNPLEEGILVGPLIDRQAADAMDEALRQARHKGATSTAAGRVTEGVPGGAYVRPAIVEIAPSAPIVQAGDLRPDPVLHDLPQS